MFPRFSMSRNSAELGPERLDKKVSKKEKVKEMWDCNRPSAWETFGEWWESDTQNLSKWCGRVS